MSNIKIYNKLVRDYIPDIIELNGGSCKIKVLSGDDYINALDAKMLEELDEYRASRDIEELADMLEVLFAMAESQGYSWIDIAGCHREKRKKRGSFDKGIFLETVKED